VPGGSVLHGLRQDVKVTVAYWTDGKPGRKLLVEYDAAPETLGPYASTGSVECPEKEGWQQAELTLPTALFMGRENAGADFRISAAGTGDVVVGDVRLSADAKAIKAIMGAFEEGDTAPLDSVEPGNAASEKAHNLKFGNSVAGMHMGRGWRHAEDWWSWDLAVDAKKPATLSCIYWGSDVGRRFDIEVNGKVIATQELQMNKPSQFFRVEYPIPPELTHGRDKVTVTFRKVGGYAGGAFTCSTQLTAP